MISERYNKHISAEEADAVKVEVSVRTDGYEDRFEGRAALVVVFAEDGTCGALTGVTNAYVLANIDRAARESVEGAAESTGCSDKLEFLKLLDKMDDLMGEDGANEAD